VDGTLSSAQHKAMDAKAGIKSDHDVDDNGVVKALDITLDKANGVDCQKIADAIRQSNDERCQYLIFNGRIANRSSIGGAAPWKWRPYHGPSAHTEHLHVSAVHDKTKYDLQTAWAIAPSAAPDTTAAAAATVATTVTAAAAIGKASDQSVWITASEIGVVIALVLVIIWIWMKR